MTSTTWKATATEKYYLRPGVFQNHHGGMVLIGDYLYAGKGHNAGFPICLELATGRVVWGGNIRNAFLYRPDRAALVPGSLRQVVDTEATPGVDAFASSRIPLAADFSFNGQTVTAISVHSTSKGGSTSLFGSVQPSVNGGEASRVLLRHHLGENDSADEAFGFNR